MSGPEADWRRALREGRIMLQRARDTGNIFFPPRLGEPGSGDRDWEWIDAPGLATVYSVSVIHPRPPEEPYNVVIVDFDGGGRLMSRVEGVEASMVKIGMRVTPQITTRADEEFVTFVPADGVRP